MTTIPWLRDAHDLEGKRVLLRIDANVPLVDGVVRDDFRLKKVMPTIEYLRSKGARIIVMSHLESPDGAPSLKPIADYFSKFFPTMFLGIEEEVDAPVDSVTLLENLRMNPGEVANDPAFAKKLASYGDIYVNDAFAVSHRAHASVVGVPEYLPSYGGLLLESEVRNLSRAFSPEHPFVFIIGGLKFQTKVPLVKKIAQTADRIYVCGALANSFWKAQGFEVGNSAVDSDLTGIAEFAENAKIALPEDLIVLRDGERVVATPSTVLKTDVIVDAGPEALHTIKKEIASAKLILWNGPLGKYEEGFHEGTNALAKAIADRGDEAFSLVGGGDTVASIEEVKVAGRFGFVSTGGGAMLDFLANETLPGLEALKKASN